MPAPILSRLGRLLAGGGGIAELMDDLGAALAGGAGIAMGGGNPAHVPALEAAFRRRIEDILARPGELEHLLGDYDQPAGRAGFRTAVAELLRREAGWDIGPDHVVVTTGSQTGAFLFFNLVAGEAASGPRRLCFPVVPEYIGYADQLLAEGGLVGCRPRVRTTAAHRFRYQADLETVPRGPDIAAYVLSRPTNPSARVADDAEVAALSDIAADHGSLLYLDNAYGLPVPGVVFTEARLPPWRSHHVCSFSLSKLGLPSTRTGILVADPAIAERIAAMNAVVGLANPNLGQAIVEPLLANGELVRLAREVLRPFYAERCRRALTLLDAALPDELPWRVHEADGAFFLWLQLPRCPIDDRELYRRLGARGVVVVPGRRFFAGLAGDWDHCTSCLRLSYCCADADLQRGVAIIGEEITRAYHG